MQIQARKRNQFVVILASVSLLISFGYSGRAQAYGHTLGNGGGVAELELTNIWSNLDRILAPCLVSSNATANICGMSSAQQAAFQRALLNKTRCHTPFNYDTLADDVKIVPTATCGAPIVVNQKNLYVNDKPKSFSDLIDIAAEMLFNSGDATVVGVGAKLSTEVFSQSIALNSGGVFAEGQQQGSIEQILLVSDSDLLDLTQLISQAVGCSELNSFTSINPQFYFANGALNAGFEVRYQCQGAGNLLANLAISLPVSDGGFDRAQARVVAY